MVAEAELEESRAATTGENIFTMVRKIGQAKAVLAADYATQLARSVGKVVLFAKHIDVMNQAEATFARRDIRSISIRGDQTAQQRQREVDAFLTDPDVKAAVCSLTAAGVGLNLQVASNVVLAELSWTAAEQQQAIDRTHRIGQDEPVTAWRIIAAHTIDAKIAELVDAKASLAARALDGDDSEVQAETLRAARRAHRPAHRRPALTRPACRAPRPGCMHLDRRWPWWRPAGAERAHPHARGTSAPPQPLKPTVGGRSR